MVEVETAGVTRRCSALARPEVRPGDERIAPLVEALSEIDGLVTLDSCQGAPPEGAEAYVSFAYGDGGDWTETGRLLERLSRSLRKCDFLPALPQPDGHLRRVGR